jgi:hypothetical protein
MKMMPADCQLPRINLLKAIYASQRRALTGTAATNERDDLARFQSQIDAPKDLKRSKALPYTFEINDVLTHEVIIPLVPSTRWLVVFQLPYPKKLSQLVFVGNDLF